MASLDTHAEDTTAHRPGLLPLSLAAIGVVYGDIGTSPLYAFREAMLAGDHDKCVDIAKDHGSWIAYDAIGVFGRG